MPSNAPMAPMIMVSEIGLAYLPGRTNRASAPMIKPTMMAVKMPVTVMLFLRPVKA